MTDINYPAIIIAALVYFGIGWAWYSDALFGKMWRKLNSMTEKSMATNKKSMAPLMASHLISALVACFVLANTLAFVAAGSIGEALQIVAWV